HLDHGLNQVIWKLGRSVVEYHSDLPTATLGDCSGMATPWAAEYGQMMRERCCLRAALEFARQHGMVIYGRLAMNRHYAPEAHGGAFTSRWAASHPDFRETSFEGKPDSSRLCYALPEVRAERLDLLLEAARIGVDGLQLDFCRQPPIARYHPELVSSFQRSGGGDPRSPDPWEGPGFAAWVAHRASYITALLRELQRGLEPLRQATGRAIPVQVRVTDNGPPIDLIAGLDIATWCAEGLIQELAVSSLNWLAEFQEHDLRPYVELGRATGVKVYGGVNALALQRRAGSLPAPDERSPVRLAERALRQYEAGADGMTLYQSDYAVWPEDLWPILPLLGDPAALADFATDPAHRHRWPLTWRNLSYGLDNHGLPRAHYHLGDGGPRV
ncbi:MAG: hypothetical protein HUU35_07155, partial [Armatimonadetes bacterium]|nr:hypothetical protein [Armatimonadota bacterium]